MLDALPFREVWAVDFEFAVKEGARPDPVCLVAWELRSGRKLKLWRSEFGPSPPYSTGPDSLFVAYYASAEIGCHLTLGWPKPARILDLFTEFRCRTNGLQTPAGSGLLGALAYYGLDAMASSEKEAMRDLILRGGDWSEQEREAILTYCAQDVAALARLLPPCSATSIFRGRFCAAATWPRPQQWSTTACRSMRRSSPSCASAGTTYRIRLIAEIDTNYGVFDGRSFKADRFAACSHGKNPVAAAGQRQARLE